MKDEKKVKLTEEVKTEEKGVELNDEQLKQVSGGKEQFSPDHLNDGEIIEAKMTAETAELSK